MPERVWLGQRGDGSLWPNWDDRPLTPDELALFHPSIRQQEYIRADLHAQLLKRAEKMEALLLDIAADDSGYRERIHAALTDQEGS